MLKRATLIAFSSLFVFALAICLLLFPTDFSAFKKIRLFKEKVSTPDRKEYPTRQMRKKVSKDLWIAGEKGERLHHRFESPTSILIAYPRGNSIELIEKMEKMKCYLQEEIDRGNPPRQQIRFIESEEGTYTFATQHFDASKVFIALFHLPGTTLPTEVDLNQAYLKGIAYRASLSFSEKTPHFTAEKLKAKIHTDKKK